MYKSIHIIGKCTIFFKFEKKITSSANDFLLHKCKNNRKMRKFNFLFSNLNKFTSPANEFLLHECRNKNEKNNYFFKFEFFSSPANELREGGGGVCSDDSDKINR